MIFHNFFFVEKNGKILELAINGYDSDICHVSFYHSCHTHI